MSSSDEEWGPKAPRRSPKASPPRMGQHVGMPMPMHQQVASLAQLQGRQESYEKQQHFTQQFLRLANAIRSAPDIEDVERMVKHASDELISFVEPPIGWNLIFYAVQRESDEEAAHVTQMLIHRGVDPCKVDALSDRSAGHSPLFHAVNSNNVSTARLLVQVGLRRPGGGVDVQDAHGQTPFFYAVREGLDDMVEFLMDAKADINHMDGNMQTPLFMAAGKGHMAMCERLIARGADPNLKDKSKRFAYYMSKHNNHRELTEFLASFNPASKHTMTRPLQSMHINNMNVRRKYRLVMVDPAKPHIPIDVTPEVLDRFENEHAELACWPKPGPHYDKPFREPALGVVEALCAHPDAFHFNAPVDEVTYSDYQQRVRRAFAEKGQKWDGPSDFGTIRAKLESGHYADTRAIYKDVMRVFENCEAYNMPDAAIVRQAQLLRDLFLPEFRDKIDRPELNKIPEADLVQEPPQPKPQPVQSATEPAVATAAAPESEQQEEPAPATPENPADQKIKDEPDSEEKMEAAPELSASEPPSEEVKPEVPPEKSPEVKVEIKEEEATSEVGSSVPGVPVPSLPTPNTPPTPTGGMGSDCGVPPEAVGE